MTVRITISKPLGDPSALALGGPGSGHWGHKGRPGRVGGSLPGSGEAARGRSYGAATPFQISRLEANGWDVSFDNLAGEHIRAPVEPGGRPLKQNALNSLELRGQIKDGLVRSLCEASGESYYCVNEVVAQWARSSNDNNYASLGLQEAAAQEFEVQLSPWQRHKLDNFFVTPERKAQLQAAWEGAEDRVNAAVTEWFAIKEGAGKRSGREESPEEQAAYAHYQAAIRAASEAQRRLTSSHVRGDPSDPNALGMLEYVLGAGARPAVRRILRAMYDRTQRELGTQGIATVKLFRGVKEQDPELPQGHVVRVRQNALSSWSASFGTANRFGSRVLAIEVPVSRVFCTARTGMGCLPEMEFILLGNTGDDDTAYVMPGIVSG